jgi:phosphoribosylglycinamide formyltransferase 1
MTTWDQHALISPVLDSAIPIRNPNETTNPRPRLGLMASGSGSNFEAIVQAINSGQLQAEVPIVIYNNPQAAVVARAAKLGIPSVCLNHRDYASREALDEAIVAVLREYGVNWVVMAGWMRIVTPVLINAFPNHVLNIHPSLLPSFKGGRAIEQAFQSGVKITGCTVHYVVPEVDSGKIIMQAAVPILETDTLESLQARLQVQEHKIYPTAIAIAVGQMG